MHTISLNQIVSRHPARARAIQLPNACPFCTQGKLPGIFQYVPCPFCRNRATRL
jgi:hypothetical protein